MKTIAKVWDWDEAEVLACRLRAQGFRPAIAEAAAVQMNWTWMHAMGGLRIQVPDHEADEAWDFVFGTWAEAPPPTAGACPRCGCEETAWIRIARDWAVALMAILYIPMPFREWRWCADCAEAARQARAAEYELAARGEKESPGSEGGNSDGDEAEDGKEDGWRY